MTIIPKEDGQKKVIFPLEKKTQHSSWLWQNPLDYRAIDDIAFNYQAQNISAHLPTKCSILDAIERYYVEGADSPDFSISTCSNISADKGNSVLRGSER